MPTRPRRPGGEASGLRELPRRGCGRQRQLPLGELARQLGASLHGGDPSLSISGVAEPADARPGQVALLTDPSRFAEGQTSAASAFVVTRIHPELPSSQLVLGEGEDPARALGRLLELFKSEPASRQPGVDPRSAVDESAAIDAEAWVGPFAYVGPGARVGAGSWVEPFSYVGEGVVIGRDCRVGPGATVLARSEVGDGAVLGPGSVVGYRGFGFWRGDDGWHSIPAAGGASIGRDVELGANTCVDAGTLTPTRVEDGVKIDNLVQVGHNCAVAARALLCAQVGLAGSVEVGEDCQLGGQVGVADHRRLGRSCRVGARSGVAQDVAEEATVSGYPAIPHRTWLRSSVIFARLSELLGKVRELSEGVAALMEKDT
jgi:UDP-3-O-[3-hydroxymyristoyl] glucosamine N-acyltransferase